MPRRVPASAAAASSVERRAPAEAEPADPGAAQRGEVAADAERGAEVAGQGADVGAGRHLDLDVDVEHGVAAGLGRGRTPSTSNRLTVTGRAGRLDVLAGADPRVGALARRP